ncbi:GpE family phage tail protein [Comamonas sediminis]|uniref:GpE family phage tail protein n=1 Tax=Comamonas sediminis TaxID=1783360 RepID=A0ABV4B4V9_9BURK
MADIAAVFHWPPDVMGRFDVDELLQWRNLAIERSNQKLRFYAQLLGKKLQ